MTLLKKSVFTTTILLTSFISSITLADYVMRIPLEKSSGGSLPNNSIMFKTAAVESPAESTPEPTVEPTPEEPPQEEENYKTIWQGSFTEYSHNRYAASSNDAFLFDNYADEFERNGNEGGRSEIYLKQTVFAYQDEGFYIVTNGGPECYFYAERCDAQIGCYDLRETPNYRDYKTSLIPLGDRAECQKALNPDGSGYNNIKIQEWHF